MTNAPEEPNSFIGRARELRELRRALESARVLTLCGVGGIGKTRLALRLAAGLAGRFPDGVWVVELGDLWDPELIPARVAAAVGVDAERGRPALDTLTDAIADRTMLILLDTCEHLVGACAHLAQRLLARAPGLRLVATSREPLHLPAEVVWQVPPLSVPPPPDTLPPRDQHPSPAAGPGGLMATQSGAPLTDPQAVARYESVRLFVDRAGAVRSGYALTATDAAAVAALCRALDGVPLAIELAAARAGALTAAQIASRIGDRFALLDSGGRAAPPRQRTLRAAIDWSHSLLSREEQTLLRRLSVFAGFSLEMAEQVCAGDGLRAGDIIDLITALVDKSLVQVEPEVLGQARYRLLDTIRDYAAQRLSEAGEALPVQRRLGDHTLTLTQRFEAIGMGIVPGPWSAAVGVFRRYDVDADNARQVLARCLADGDVETGLRICTAIAPCWVARGAFTEGSDWFGRFLSAAAPGLPAGVRGAALIARARLVLADDPASAAAWAAEGLAASRAEGEGRWAAAALNVLAVAAQHAGRLTEAAQRADEACHVAREAGNAWNEGYALGTSAAVAALSGRLREAQRFGDAALGVMRRIDHQWGVARTLLGLGALARLRGDLPDALRCYQAALPMLREIESRPETARCLAGIARVALDQGDLGLARDHLTESLLLSQATGARTGIARGLEGFAELAGRHQQPDLAVRLAAVAAGLRERAGLPARSGAWTQRTLAPARGLGDLAVARLWAEGKAMTVAAAVTMAVRSLGTRDAATRARIAAAPGLAAPAIPAAGAQSPPSSLTRREREVVALVAAGRSNRSLARDLSISPATAARHVANISRKLGLSSRAQIAAWAVSTGTTGPPSE